MPDLPSSTGFIGGRLALDFANELGPSSNFSFQALLHFLLAVRVISPERSAQLLSLPQSDPQTADGLLVKAQRLHAALSESFAALIRNESVTSEWIRAVNDVLRITEGHDELVFDRGQWRLEFVAREEGLEWLLAAVARSGAEIIAEAPAAPLRICSNPSCGLFFYDTSRTHVRRWCSMARCGNRSKVAAFSRRHAASRRSH